jgi:hypothetical protein
VPPGQEGKITLQVEHTDGYTGEVSKSAQVVTNDPTNQSFNLLLRAYFKGEQPATAGSVVALAGAGKLAGPFNISPSDRWNTSVLSGSSSAGTLTLYNGSGTPVHVKQLKPGGTDFTASFQTIEDGKRYELSIATNPALKPGQYHQTLKIVTDSKQAPELEIDLAVTVFPQVFVTPNVLTIPQMSSAQDLSAVNLPLIYVRKLRGEGLKVKSVSSTLPFLTLTLSTEIEGQRYTLRVTLDRSKITTPGEFKGKIRIETNDPDTPVLEVPVQGSFT